MKCEFCEAENAPNANFCSNCGSPANLQVCPKCEAINESAAVTCVNCGQALEQGTTSDNDEDRTVPPAPAPTEDSDATQPAAEEAKIRASDILREWRGRHRSSWCGTDRGFRPYSASR